MKKPSNLIKDGEKFSGSKGLAHKQSVHIESYGVSDIGCVRHNNEDVWAAMSDRQFFILADGMGGHKAGEVAAKQAILKVCQYLERFLTSCPTNGSNSLEKMQSVLRQAILEANAWVYKLSKENEEYRGMGTTLCCFLFFNQHLIYAHVGDSRIYKFKKNLTLLTKDHSLRGEWLSKGHLSEEEAASFPFKNVITRAIGSHPNVEPEIKICPVEFGEIYFLCSDGLTDYVKDPEIKHILTQTCPIKESADRLVQLAKEKGGSDNISVVIVKVLPPHEKSLFR